MNGKWVVAAACLLWMSWAVWDQFVNMPTGEVENHSSVSVQERMRDCSGTFQQRYECKNAIVIETDRSAFFTMIERIVIVVLPPLLLVGGLRLLGWRRNDDDGGHDEIERGQHRRRYHRRSSGR